MAHFPHQYGSDAQYDQYGNPIPQTDDYGNPMNQSGVGQISQDHATLGDILRTGSSSSSSTSEDDGQGGRRKKKGLKEKIKEKIPGAHDKDGHRSRASSTTTPGGFSSAEPHHGMKGMIHKIKEKLPGSHHHKDEDGHQHNT